MVINAIFIIRNLDTTMTSKIAQPIGVFDSGMGGLTVTKALVELLPNESIVYFGDTAHLPYGDKSAATIYSYGIKIIDFLLQQNCKLIVIACNSAAAAAYQGFNDYIAGRVPLIDVIEPMIDFLQHNFLGNKVGLIGTRQTINSKIYQQKIAMRNLDIDLQAVITPLLVPVIEEGLLHDDIVDLVLAKYLASPNLQGIQAIVLGCTHYPLIKHNIANFYKGNVSVIESSAMIACTVRLHLNSLGLLNTDKNTTANRQFYVSDYTEAFANCAKLFFSQDIKLKQHVL
jgi:glutamate racemase